MADGRVIAKDTLGVKWERLLDSDRLVLHELIEVRNFGRQHVESSVMFTFNAGFEDIYTVRQLLDERPGQLYLPEWLNGVLSFLYEGADGIYRQLTIAFSPAPASTEDNKALFHLSLDSGEKSAIAVALCVREANTLSEIETSTGADPELRKSYSSLKRESETWLRRPTEIISDSLLMDKVINRSFRDVHVLTSKLADQTFIAAGVPWFVTLFGRDRLVTSLQMLAYERAIAEQILRLLAKYQGKKVDAWRDEQPGKILHEVRTGELARLNEMAKSKSPRRRGGSGLLSSMRPLQVCVSSVRFAETAA